MAFRTRCEASFLARLFWNGRRRVVRRARIVNCKRPRAARKAARVRNEHPGRIGLSIAVRVKLYAMPAPPDKEKTVSLSAANGKYDQKAEEILREGQPGADACVVIVLGRDAESGFSVAAIHPVIVLSLPDVLRDMADKIEGKTPVFKVSPL